MKTIKLSTSTMHITKTLTYFALAVATAAGSAIPSLLDRDMAAEVSPSPAHLLDKRDSFSCSGSPRCGTRQNMAKVCDDAINTLRRGNRYVYAAST